MSAYSIIVELLMKTGSFVTDNERAAKSLQKLKKQAYETGRQIGDSLTSIGSAVGISLTVAGLGLLVRSSIDAADHLNDLSKRAGISVESLGGIGYAASNAGGDLDSAAAATGKLNKAIAGAVSGNKDFADTFAAIGVSVTDATGHLRGTDDVIADLADKFAGWEDGPLKSAVALKLFGKAGEAMIPLLNDGGKALRDQIAYYNKYAGITTDVAQRADQFNDTIGKLNLLSGAFGRTLASELLVPLQSLADYLVDAKEKGDGMRGVALAMTEAFKGLVAVVGFLGGTIYATGQRLSAFAAQAGTLIDAAAEARKNSGPLDVFGSGGVTLKGIRDAFAHVQAIGKETDADIDAVRKNYFDLLAKMNGKAPGAAGFSDARFEAARAPAKTQAPKLPDAAGASAAAKDAAREAQKAYDAAIQAQRDFAQQQKATFDYANRLLDNAFDDGLSSLRTYHAQQAAIRDAALASQLKAVNAEIDIRKREANDSRLDPSARTDAAAKAAQAEQKRSEIVVGAAREATLARQNEQRAFEDYAARLLDLQAQLAEGAGDDQLASSLRASRQLADAMRTVNAVGADPGIVEQLRLQIAGRADLARVQTDYGRLLERARDSEERAILAAQEGNAGEIETLRAVATARAASLQQLGALVDKANELALALGTPEAIRAAEQLSSAYRRAAAEVDPVLQHIRDVGGQIGSTIADGLADAALAGDSLHETLNNLDKALARIALNELFTKPLQNWLSGMAGGNGQASGGGGWIGAIDGAISAWFGGGKAAGGFVGSRSMFEVAERGPELYEAGGRRYLLTGAENGRIDPRPRMSSGGPGQIVNQTFVVQGRIDKKTQMQLGAEASRGARLAHQHNN